MHKKEEKLNIAKNNYLGLISETFLEIVTEKRSSQHCKHKTRENKTVRNIVTFKRYIF